MKYVCCVCERDIGMLPKSTDDQTMRSISECRVRFGHCGRSFLSPVIYKSVPAKRIVMPGSVFRALSHFRNTSTDAVHLTQITS